ncbi:MAG: tetratricopeptide repeat protein [Anaerolineaceae bacterium]|nr:tetratricopeptide repeat protein [Anaerolineaceae bacterium]
MLKRKRRSNPWRVFFLLILVGSVFYINQFIVPNTPPLFIPTSTPTRSPGSYIAEAEAFLEDGKNNLAIKSYEEAIQSDPKNVGNFVIVSRLQIYQGDFENAITNAENALLLNPNNATAHALRGWALGFQGNYLLAIGAVTSALELEPNNASAHAIYAEILALQVNDGVGDLGTKDKAIEESRIAKDLAPTLLESYRARGLVLEITGNYQEAALEFEAAININPNIADLHLSLGRNYRYLQIYDKAVEEFNTANALNPSDYLPETYISRTYAAVGEYAKAIQYAQQAVVDKPEETWLYGNLGTMFYRNLQYRDAIDALSLAVRGGTTEDGQQIEGLPLDYGRVAEYYYIYGLSLARYGDCGEALQISQAILQGVPNDETAVFNAEEMVNICKEYTVNGTPTPMISETEPQETDLANEEDVEEENTPAE